MDHSPEASSSKKPPRRYAFACTNCRKKKIRCDGNQPECYSCVRAEEVCQYPKKRMEAQLAQAQKRIQELEAELHEARSNSPYGSQTASSPGALYSDTEQDYSIYSQVGFDERGSITYHGPTSRFQESVFHEENEDDVENAELARDKLREIYQREFRNNHNYLHNVWQPSLSGKTDTDFGIPVDVANHLILAFFTWQNSFHNFVYRPLFIRDLALGSPAYCSPFLLNCVFALAARQCSHNSPVYRDQGEAFLTRARELLVGELSRSRPEITTIQGLLILGCRQCSIGNTSEGWLFSGMAFRMMADIGLHLNPQIQSKYENLSSSDLEARKRLAVSAYTWDKLLSLTLGRPPALPKLWTTAEDVFDEFDDKDYWQPLECEHLTEYRAARSHTTTTFKYLSQLAGLVNGVLATMTGRGQSQPIDGQIESIQNRLESWYHQLPSVMRIDDPSRRSASPPPHILSLNLLFRTLILILLRHYQRVRGSSRSMVYARKLQSLAEQASLLHDALLLYCRTFQYKAQTHIISYCVYTAATVDIGFFRIGNEEQRHAAAVRLKAMLKLLEAEAQHTPGVKKSVDTIKKQIKKAAREREQASTSPEQQAVSHQPSFDQAFATSHQSTQHDIPAPSAMPMQHNYTRQHSDDSSYFPGYTEMAPSQHHMLSQEVGMWHLGQATPGVEQAYQQPQGSWTYAEQNYQEAVMYGWPPTSR